MGAAENTEDAWNGVEAGTGESGNNTNVPLGWRPVYVRARTIIGNVLAKGPFSWPPSSSPSTTSTYDQIEGTAEQVTWRYVDAYGNVWDQKALNLVLIEWLLDGAPTPLTLAKVAEYWSNAGVLRPWPTGFSGAQPGEPQETYPVFPPAST
jgi:hypothetical protein